jgi:glycine cleavage system transcriptional repressor
MNDWQILTLVGGDRPGIVAAVSQRLFEAGFALGEASMMRLGGNFTIMLMVRGGGDVGQLLAPVAESLGLHLHVFPAGGALHRHLVPNIQLRVHGADRAGIVAQITGTLAEHGFNILELESDVAGTEAKPVYVLYIQGYCERPLEEVQTAIAALGDDLNVDVSSIETLIG